MLKRDAYPEALSWNQRLAAATVVIAAHLALLISVKTQISPAAALSEVGQGGVSIEIAEMAARAAPSSPPRAALAPTPTPSTPPPKPDPATPELIEHPETLGLPAPSTDLAPISVIGAATRPRVALAGIPSDDPCHYAQVLQTALQGDDEVRRALALIPRASRSVANAIMVWNGQWVPVPGSGGDGSLAPVRAAIVNSLASTSAECLTRVNTGPLFVTIPGFPDTTVLALGSGQWRASDLIAGGTDLGPALISPRNESLWSQSWPG
jgi:hypothetical protein